MVQRAPPRRGVLPHPAGAPAGRAHQESEADAAAAPPGGRAIGFEGKSPHQGPARQAAETVTAAAAEIIPGLVQQEGNYVVTTDLGNEFRGLEEALPEGAVHRQKDPTDRNATAVVDRAIQTLKKDLAGKVARDGGGWAEHVDEATEAYNARPHEAVTVAPEDVETMPAATFRVYQDNARKFKHNDELTRSRQRRLEEAGAFRAPTNAARSFQPQYGAVREVSSYDSMTVRATDGPETLLKHALPVPPRVCGAQGAAHPPPGAAGGAATQRFQSRAHGAAVIASSHGGIKASSLCGSPGGWRFFFSKCVDSGRLGLEDLDFI